MCGGLVFGCHGLSSWDGHRPVFEQPLAIGSPLHASFPVARSKRYVVGVRVTFEAPGDAELVARFPMVASVKDESGSVLAKSMGWFDPNEPSANVVREGLGAQLTAEREIGPFVAARDGSFTFDLDLGPDRIHTESSRVSHARVVVSDDAWPRGIILLFVVAGAGALAFFVGASSLLLRLFRTRHFDARRGGIRARQIV